MDTIREKREVPENKRGVWDKRRSSDCCTHGGVGSQSFAGSLSYISGAAVIRGCCPETILTRGGSSVSKICQRALVEWGQRSNEGAKR